MPRKKLNVFLTQLVLFIFLYVPALAQMQTQVMNHIIVGPPASVPIIPHIHNHQFIDPSQSINTSTTHQQSFGTGTSFVHFHHHQTNQNIDLSSTTDTTKGGHLLKNESVNINVGGSQMTVTSHTPLTESEKLAVLQVLFAGHQSLVLDAQGSTDGGSLTIGSRLSQHLSNLVIPHGVTVTDISHSGILNLSGNLNDSGTLNLITAHFTSSTFSILAGNIIVGSQGLISTSGNLNLFSRSGDITNNGTISSTSGSISINAPKNTDININSNNGIFSANNGNINFRDSSYTGAANINLNGDNYLSQNLNLYSGNGSITANVGKISGNLNTQAASEHLFADTDNLNLGNNTINGDPTFVSTGNITVTGSNTFTEDVAIIAEGNITAGNNSAAIIDNGHNVTLIAGATVSTTGTSNSGTTTIPTSTDNISGSTGTGNGTGSFTATVNPAVPTGGNIDFTQSNATTIITASGGSVTLLACANGAGTGNIWFPTTTTSINTANNSGTGGAVTIIAAGNGGTAQSGPISQAIQLGSIVTAAANQTGNAVNIETGPVVVFGGSSASFDTHGTTTATFSVSAASGGSINLGSINASGTGGAAQASVSGGDNINAGGNIIASRITLEAGANITQSSGSLQSPIISLTAVGSIGISGTPISINNGGNGITEMLAVAPLGNVYLSDTAHEDVILANDASAGEHSAAGSIFSLSTYGDINSAPDNMHTGLAIQAPTILLNSSNGNIVEINGDHADGIQISGVALNGVTLYVNAPLATASTGYVSITDNSAETIVLSTSNTNSFGTCVAGSQLIINASGNLFAYDDTHLAIQSPAILLSSGGSVAADSSNDPLLISGGGGGTEIAMFVSGSIYLQDTTHEDVTIVTVNQAGFPTTAGAVFSLNAYGNIQATDTTQAIQAPNILLVSTNGNIATTGTTPMSIGNGTSGITLYASATNGSVYLTDTGNENVTLTTAATTGTSTASSTFSLNTGGSILQDTAGSTSISSPTVVLTSTNGGTIGSLNIAAANITFNTSGNVTFIDSNAITTTGASTGNNVSITDSADSGITTTNQITATGTLSLINTGTDSPINIGTGLFGTVITLTATGSGNIIGSHVVDGSISVIMNSPTGAINLSLLNTPTITTTQTTTGSGSVSLTDEDSIAGNGVSTAGTGGFSLTIATGGPSALTINHNITSGGAITLTNNDSGSPITISANLTGTSASLNTLGQGNITGSGIITANSVSTSSPSGVINLSGLATPNVTTTQTIGINGGTTFVDSVALTGNGSSVGAQSFSLTDTAAGGITITNTILAPHITLDATTGGVTVNSTITGLIANTLQAAGPMIIGSAGTVLTTTGNILFETPSGPGAISVQNNGSINDTYFAGIVGFNGGPTGTISITGNGTISGGFEVNVGNLNTTTLAIQNPFIVVSPFTGSFTAGGISITQSAISGTLQVTTDIPAPPTPPRSGGSLLTVSTGLTVQQKLFFELQYLALLLSLQQQANNKLYEQIGTRIATDYTPWTTYWRQPLLYPQPLQGSVIFNRISEANSALFAASEFNANELTALSRAGIVFGSTSKNNFFDLVKGYVLFIPSSDIQVQTREGIVFIPKGAVAEIRETGSDAAIYDYHDTLHTGAIKVTVNKRNVFLAPGKELLLTRNTTADFTELNPGNKLAYRNVGSTDFGSGIKGFVSDFSIPHGLTNVPVIHNLLISNNLAIRKTIRQIMKDAVIKADLSGYPEYQ